MPKILTHEEYLFRIHEAVGNQALPVSLPAVDPTIYCPSKRWIENDFRQFLKENMTSYITHTDDCDDQADAARFFMRLCLRGTPDAQGHGNPLGIARVWITGPPLLGVSDPSHENNIIVTDEGEALFLEPQRGRLPGRFTRPVETAIKRGGVQLAALPRI